MHAYLLDGRILSKDEAGEWAVRTLPEEFRGMVRGALEIYRGNDGRGDLDDATQENFIEYMRRLLPDEQV